MSGANNYSANFSDVVDLIPNDWSWVYYTDAKGNQVYSFANAPVTTVWKNFNQVYGYVDPSLTSVTVALKNASNSTRTSRSFIPSASGYYYADFWDGNTRIDVAAGDTAEVVPVGGPTMSVPVVGLTAALDTNANTISGSAPANSILHTYVWHWLGSSYSGSYHQGTTSAGGGPYSASPGIDVVGGRAVWRQRAELFGGGWRSGRCATGRPNRLAAWPN